jgi:hypothetical protein
MPQLPVPPFNKMTGKVSVVIEQDEHDCYAGPEPMGASRKARRSRTLVICEAIELFLETLTDEERLAALSREILTTAVEVHA